ncbi:hypothetical protein PhCBS80983_g04464 [Powellomyces hirtus]|uniref:DFDF domain-containing protein n=1 Tax=Powellomyces hirtus TaxID=109895 RepID=A0A507DYF0_9FUNG|nr:hypothetical protein PhCBS80983_g04464 [Powellomyces hirtus]
MAYIGSKISLISKSDIRYVGTLIEINQEQSTVSLQDVQSWGTEGRRGNPSEELPPSDEAYPYVVFRGSDVKDLHVMTAPERPPPAPMRVPNDPAVIRSGGPTPGSSSGPTPAGPPPDPSGPPRPPGFQGYGGGPGGMMGQPGQYPGMPGSHPYGMPPQPMGFGYPPPPPHMLPQKQPYWGPQGDQQRPPSGHPGSMGPGSQMHGQPLPQQQAQEVSPVTRETPVGQTQSSKVASSDETDLVQNFDTLDLNESAVLPGDRPTREPGQKAKPTGPQRADAYRGAGRTTARRPQQGMAEQVDRPTPAAKKEDAVETKQHEEKAAETGAAQPSEKDLNAEASVRNENMRLPGTGAHLLNSGPRRGRGRGRGGSSGQMRNNRITVPDSDFDFEIANAKFNKTELANEASTSTSTAAAPKPVHVSPTADVVAPTNDGYEEEEEHEDDEGFYQKSSFFDNISCESKDRADSEVLVASGSMRNDDSTWKLSVRWVWMADEVDTDAEDMVAAIAVVATTVVAAVADTVVATTVAATTKEDMVDTAMDSKATAMETKAITSSGMETLVVMMATGIEVMDGARMAMVEMAINRSSSSSSSSRSDMTVALLVVGE